MADTSVPITAGTGTSIDTRTESTNGNHRQVVVLGDPTTNAGVAAVDATKGLAVDLTNTGANTTAIKVDGSAATQPISGSVTVTQATASNLNTTVSQATGSNLHTVIDSGVITTVSTVTTVTTVGTVTNLAQMNGVAITMGNGAAGTGVQRVAIASDNTVLPGVGAGATGSAVPANASYKGVIASTALPSAASAGNLTGAMGDKFGRQVVLPVTIRDLVGTQTTTISASTSETTVVTAAASTFNDIMMFVVSNTSATGARVDFRDTTAGSILFSLYVPATDVRGFSLGGVPIPQTSVNTNWTAQSSASVTDLRIYAVFVKNK